MHGVVLQEGTTLNARFLSDASTVSSKVDAQRVREQRRYFGLEDASWVITIAVEAKEYVEKVLSEPFTVHTAFASAGGRSAKGRVYAFVTTSDGVDLGRLLVARGYARAYGIGRKTPKGDSRDDTNCRGAGAAGHDALIAIEKKR